MAQSEQDKAAKAVGATRFRERTNRTLAVQVTDRNIEKVAAWCHGDVTSVDATGEGVRGARELRVTVLSGTTKAAYEGDWVVWREARDSFDVFADDDFTSSFEDA